MKLKNSYILLIVMSIFLLVSIGSVCASDAAMDADILAEDNGISVEPVADSTPIKTTVESKNVIVNKTDAQKIPVTVKDDESQNINIAKGDLNVTENKKALKFDYVNSSITLTDKLAAGNHSILINYLGNANYSSSSKTVKLSVIGDKFLNASSTINVNSSKKVVIPITLTDGVNVYDINRNNNLSLTASYEGGNKTVNISKFDLKNKAIEFDYGLDVTTCNLTITYLDNNKTLTKNVVLKRIDNAKITPENLEAQYASGNFTFKLVDVDSDVPLSGKKLSYTIITGSINTGGSVTTDEKGIATIDNSNLNVYSYNNGTISTAGHINVGKQLFSIKGDDSSISAPEIKDNFTVTKAKINIVINPYKEVFGSEKKVVINVTNAETNAAMKGIILHLYMANTTANDYYFQTDGNGTALINASGLVGGTYSLTVSNNDTKNIDKKSVDGSITILPKPVKVAVTFPKTYYYNSGNIATIKVTDKSTGKAISDALVLVQVYTGKKSQGYLYQTNSKGIATVNYAPAAVGSHKIVVTTADTRYSGNSVTKTVTVKKATATFTAPKVTAYYKGGKNLVITLKNSKTKKPVYAAKVNVKVFISSNRYYNYNGQTGLDGKIRISLDTYKPGTYKVVVSKGESKNFTASQKTTSFVVKKAPAKLSPAKLTAKKGASKYFKVTVKNTKTNKVIKGVKVKIKVYTGKTTKTYTIKTNSKGIAQLNVKSLKVGTHKVVVTSGNKYVTAKTAKSSIKITK